MEALMETLLPTLASQHAAMAFISTQLIILVKLLVLLGCLKIQLTNHALQPAHPLTMQITPHVVVFKLVQLIQWSFLQQVQEIGFVFQLVILQKYMIWSTDNVYQHVQVVLIPILSMFPALPFAQALTSSSEMLVYWTAPLKTNIQTIQQDNVLVHVLQITTKMISRLNVLLIAQHPHLSTLFLRTKENVQHLVLKELSLISKKENV